MSSIANSDVAAPAHAEFKKRLQEAIDLKNQKRYEDAAAILEELRETDPASASVHGILGHVLWEQGKLPKAIRSFRQAVKISPSSELASLGLFHTLRIAGKKVAALREMDRFLRVKKSIEYEAIAKEYRLEMPRSGNHAMFESLSGKKMTPKEETLTVRPHPKRREKRRAGLSG